jgi:hypothetical protein
MAIHLTPEANPTVQEGTLYVDSATGEFNVAGRTTPHIIPGVLYPSYVASGTANKLLDGTTSHSGAFGTEQADGRKYYYTNIAGSKPIKDPRIGGHFGSQRHRFSSAQLLEQETATQGDNVYSIDGREWVRAVGDVTGSYNNSHGTRPLLNNTSSYFEIVGYFSSINISSYGYDNAKFRYSLDGASEVGTDYGPISSGATPLGSRYVTAGSLVNIPISTTLGIHTIKLRNNHGTATSSNEITDIELIAQDTTSTANRSKIQIPSQDVVSYGKKFTVSGTPHYDPFNGFVDDTTLFSAKVDTATSLGLGTATTWGASWDTGSDDHIRPFNGGRVIKWVDSSGAIKTSVTMMPRNAQNKNTTASNEITDVSSTNSHTINFSDDAVENSLSEVAKTFDVREFGNGNANGGATGTYKDVSMLDTTGRDVGYVMDDGLTCLSAASFRRHGTFGIYANADGKSMFITFIGTGIGVNCLGQNGSSSVEHRMYVDGIEAHYMGSNPSTGDGLITVAQNLPYGTHIFEFKTITKGNADAFIKEVTIYQPKRPPISEDCVVLADYMLMADHVKRTAQGIGTISKGVRLISSTRDIFYDMPSGNNPSGWAAANPSHPPTFFRFYQSANSNAGLIKTSVPAFGTSMELQGWNHNLNDFYVNGSDIADTDVGSTNGLKFTTQDTASTLGLNKFEARNSASSDGNFQCFFITTPIHTSHHYQAFETPFLNELVGGDRNMEQTNLVCSPDGKSWDEITRDVSYMGREMTKPACTSSNDSSSANIIFDTHRGQNEGSDLTLKNFAYGYDRFICLRDGMYEIMASTMKNINTTYHVNIWVNETRRKSGHSTNINHDTITNILTTHLKRGDYVRLEGGWYGSAAYSHFHIIRLEK